jgi:hypothetical protein
MNTTKLDGKKVLVRPS